MVETDMLKPGDRVVVRNDLMGRSMATGGARHTHWAYRYGVQGTVIRYLPTATDLMGKLIVTVRVDREYLPLDDVDEEDREQDMFVARLERDVGYEPSPAMCRGAQGL